MRSWVKCRFWEDKAAKYHYQTGEKVADLGIDQLIVIGDGADEIGHGALQTGMDQNNVYFCKDSDETYEFSKNLWMKLRLPWLKLQC